MTDHERPLSKWGRHTAADIANKLNQPGWFPELILCRSDVTMYHCSLREFQYRAFDMKVNGIYFWIVPLWDYLN
jgi:hypothetical protein